MLLGREPDPQPMKGLVEWQFEAGGWLQVNENRQLAGRSSVTLVETDLDDRINQLKKAGIEPKSVMRREQVSVVIVTDPDGNQVVSVAAASPTRGRPVSLVAPLTTTRRQARLAAHILIRSRSRLWGRAMRISVQLLRHGSFQRSDGDQAHLRQSGA